MDLIVSIYSSPYNYDDINEVKKNKVGLILGTSKYSSKGVVNLYYKNRIDATYKLFKAGKIEFVLISGDNSEIYYNEPITIQKDLIKKGVPEGKIFLDYAGFRTYDSIIRAKKIPQNIAGSATLNFLLSKVITVGRKTDARKIP